MHLFWLPSLPCIISHVLIYVFWTHITDQPLAIESQRVLGDPKAIYHLALYDSFISLVILCLLPWAHGTKAGTILANSSGLFLCPVLPMILFSMFETCPGSWFNISENLKSVLS